jgi:hypothetical protein
MKMANDKTKICPYCKEDDRSKIKSITIDYHYENPQAYGYPELCFWHDKYLLGFCPVCGRRIFTEKEIAEISKQIQGV